MLIVWLIVSSYIILADKAYHWYTIGDLSEIIVFYGKYSSFHVKLFFFVILNVEKENQDATLDRFSITCSSKRQWIP